jgi:uncharacterized protein (DUF2147 family)
MRLSTLQAAIGMTAILGATPAFAVSAQDVYGVWRHPDNGSLIQIFPCDGAICAKIVWVADTRRKDINNPDPALRNRPLVGIEIWRHAKETARFQWSGSGYNTLDGAVYYGTVHLTGSTTLVVAGCNLSVTPCFERTWAKVDAETAKAVSTLIVLPKAATPKETPVAEKTEAPAPEKQIAEKPKLPPAPKAPAPKAKVRVQKPAQRPVVRAAPSGDQHGYYDLPHIHIGRD